MSKIVKVKFSPISPNDELVEYVVCNCNFCNKQSSIKIENYKNILKLGHQRYYCSFCLRNNFTYKRKNNVLILDFKGIIGFYVNQLYPDDLWLTDIIDYIQKHYIVGSRNPTFFCDRETMLWFIDFSKIGNSKHKINVEQVINSVNNIIDSFELNKNLPSIDEKFLKEKYSKAINEFYSFRKRPEDKVILSPTLKGCTHHYKYNNVDWELTKDFHISFFLSNETIDKFEELSIVTEDLKTPLNSELTVLVKKRKINSETFWEGVVKLPGLAKSKISTKEGKTVFETKNSLSATARYTAKALGLKIKFQEETSKV